VTAYTILVMAPSADGSTWQPAEPAENLTCDGAPQDLAALVASVRTATIGGYLRVCVWYGHDADIATEAAFELDAGDDPAQSAVAGYKTPEQLELDDWFIDPERAGRRPAVVVAIGDVDDRGHLHLTLDDATRWGPWAASYPVGTWLEMCSPPSGTPRYRH